MDTQVTLLSDDELNAVTGGECSLEFTRVPCPIGHLEVTTTNCPGVEPVVVRWSA
jgi:bacteriocin-like protein